MGGPEQAALAQSQHFDQLEALWNQRSPPQRRKNQVYISIIGVLHFTFENRFKNLHSLTTFIYLKSLFIFLLQLKKQTSLSSCRDILDQDTDITYEEGELCSDSKDNCLPSGHINLVCFLFQVIENYT